MTKMSTCAVSEVRQGPFVWLTLNRPQVKNALNGEMVLALLEAFERLGADSNTRAIVLAGRGDAFCSGVDLTHMQNMAKNPLENQQSSRALSDLFCAIAACPKPVVARVQGVCFAGALGVVCASDVLVASHQARFCLPEVRRGLIPATISPFVVQALGVRAARRYVLTGEVFSAQRAYELGMVHAVCDAPDLDECVQALLDNFLLCGPWAMGQAKRLVLDVSGEGVMCDALHADVAMRLAKVREGAEAAEGMAAFLEKRKPRWAL